MLYHIPLNGYLCYDPNLSLGKKWMRCDYIESKKSYFFEYEEIMKPLLLLEILGPP